MTSNDDSEEYDSLPSSLDSESQQEEETESSDAEREWKESLQQIELLLTMVLIPYLGKYFGRRCAYWGEFDDDDSMLVFFSWAWVGFRQILAVEGWREREKGNFLKKMAIGRRVWLIVCVSYIC